MPVISISARTGTGLKRKRDERASGLRRTGMLARLAAVLPVVAACPKPAVVAGPPPDPGALYIEAKKAHGIPQTLSCEAKAFVEAPENAGRYALHVSVKRPASLRIEALTAMGDPAAVLVADRGRFALLDLRTNVFYRGPATPENLSRLIPAPLRDEELVALLTGDIPELPGGRPDSATRDGDGYRLVIAAPRVRQEVVLGGDLRVVQVRRFDAASNLLWSVVLGDHDDASGAQLPRLLHLDAPPGQTKVDLKLRNVLAGKPPPSGAFLLGAPPGMRVEEVQ